MDYSLTDRTLSGARWMASSALAGRIIGFVRAIILARLLVPDDFGVFSMAVTVVGAFEALTRLGLEQSVIASRYSNSGALGLHLDTAWTVEIVKRIAMAVVLTLAAPSSARFYGVDELRVVLPVFGAVLIIQGLQNIGLFILRRQLSFKKILWHESITLTITALASILLAVFVRRDVWALVWGELIGAAAGVFTSYALFPRWPRLALARSALSRIFGFGKHALVIGIAAYITTTADNIVVGRLLGAAALGAYALAYNVISMSSIAVADVFNKVTLPAYAELSAERPEKIADAFAKVFAWSAAVLAVITAMLWVCAEELVAVMYGEKWALAGTALKILSVLGFVRGIVLVISSLLLGIGRPELVARGKLFEAALFVAIIYPLVLLLGVTGAAWTGVIVYSLALIMRLRLLNVAVPETARTVGRSVLTSVACGFCGIVLGTFASFSFDGVYWRLVVGAASSVTGTGFACWLLMKDLHYDTKRLFPPWLLERLP
ncbi:MAG TPA: oligosaccharide flippase family protein [Pyrinomonadaceae bacterium]|nr:oligosaccharide flippase family protein [Pyrinomonadaceae bacterium]